LYQHKLTHKPTDKQTQPPQLPVFPVPTSVNNSIPVLLNRSVQLFALQFCTMGIKNWKSKERRCSKGKSPDILDSTTPIMAELGVGLLLLVA